jgi:tRNA-Thr(GGU) m(6)t(6)A37 methyltransferase TsaA
MKINIKPIVIIYSPYKDLKEIPCQAFKSKKIGRVKVFKKFAKGLQDIEGFSHIILVYYFHKSKDYTLIAKPFLGDQLKGIFAIRSPHRPNHICISIVKLLRRKDSELFIRGIDALNRAPLLDIKPYVPVFDERKKGKNRLAER